MEALDHKRCFTCKKLKLLFQFHKNHRSYQLPSDKGRVVDCRLCTCKRFIKQNGETIKYNSETKKYDTIVKKVSIINIIKEYLN